MNEENLFQWNSRIKMLGNPILWGNFLVVFGAPILVLGIVLGLVGKIQEAILLAGGLFAFFAVIWFVTGMVIDLGGGFFASYRITSKGIYFASGKSEKAVADAVTAAGALAGSAGTAGAGLLARAEQSAFIEWGEIKKVKVRERSRHLFIRKEFGSKPIGLYCTEENFQKIRDLVQSKCL